MKLMMRGLALTAALIVPAATQAELVLDNFTSAASTGVVGATRSAVTTSLGSLGLFNGAGQLLNVAAGAGGWTEFTLTYAPAIAAPILGFNHYLQLRGLTTVGDWTVTITARNAGAGDPTPGVMVGAIADASTTATIDLTGLSDVGNLNGLNSLKIRFTNVTDNAGSRVFQIDQMAAVPEPTSMALLGLTALGGFFVNRRRKKTVVA